MDILYIALLIALLAVLAGGLLALRVQHTFTGSETMQRGAEILRRTALPISLRAAFALGGTTALFFLIFTFVPGFSLRLAFAALVGAAFTGASALFAAHTSARAISRTAAAVSRGPSIASRIALMGSGSGAFTAAGAALFGLAGLFMLYSHGTAAAALSKEMVRDLVGFAFGAGAAALFFRCGAGIAGQAAALAKARTAGIGKDERQNPAFLSAAAADMTAGAAGTAAEYSFILAVALAASLQLGLVAQKASIGAVYPFLIAASGLVTSLLSALYVLRTASRKPHALVRSGQLSATVLMLLAALFITLLTHLSLGVLAAVAIGAAAGCIVALADDYNSSAKLWPARFAASSLAESPDQGILDALWLAARSTAVPVITVAIAAIASFAACNGFSEPAKGMFGLALAALGAVSAGAYRTAVAGASCILTQSGRFAAYTGASDEGRTALSALQEDAPGSACGSTGHGVATAALAAFALFAAFASAANLPSLDMNQPIVLAGLLLGAAFPLLAAGTAVRAARLTAQALALEVRRQYAEITGLVESTAEANYERCAEVGSARALRSLISVIILLSLIPLLGLLAKFLKIWFYAKASAAGGAELLGSIIFGAAISGLIIGLMAACVGGVIAGAGRRAPPASAVAPNAEASSAAGLGAALASAAAPMLAYAPLIIAVAALMCTQWLS